MKTETELRELDLFCAEHVMGFPKIGGNDSLSRYVKFGGYIFDERADKFDAGVSAHHFKPTTNPADAMAVFEKCLAKLPRSLEISFDADSPGAGYFISRTDDDASQAVIADTLPLAICRFSKMLFDKNHQ